MPHTPVSTSPAPDDVPASILIVDDYPANLIAMEAVLEPLGRRIVRATSGAAAIARLEDEEFAVVLLDVMMPGLDGFETAARLRQSDTGRYVPIIFVTASNETAAAAKGYARGAVDFLRKPFDPDVLRAKVAVFVDLYVQRELVRRQAALLRDRERLIGVLGHDLRNPLSAITLSAATALKQPDLPPLAVGAIERVARSAGRMARMISGLMDFTRSRHGGLPIVPVACDLHTICRHVVDEAQAANPNRTIDLRAEGDGHGTWDAERLAQVVSNLLANAIAYSPADSVVQITVRDAGPAVALEVHNQGPPIAPSAMAALFDPFQRAASSESRRPASQPSTGLGLGLYIVDQIVRSHHGSVQVTSEEARGTCFRVELPRQALASPDRA